MQDHEDVLRIDGHVLHDATASDQGSASAVRAAGRQRGPDRKPMRGRAAPGKNELTGTQDGRVHGSSPSCGCAAGALVIGH